MSKIQVFDPAMCCNTGVCGPEVDPALVALGAAIASNCEPCFKFHYDQAHKLGVTDADMRRAVDLAQQVKHAPARAVLDLAHRYLDKQTLSKTISVTAASTVTSEGGCCGPAAGKRSAASAKCC